MTKPVLPTQQITFKVRISEDKENEYKLDFPDTSGLMEIEIIKANLSRGAYETISKTNTISADFTRFMIDMIALFSVCCPDLKKDLKVDAFSKLQVLESKMLLGVYINQILPWWSKWEEVLNTPFETDTKVEEKEKV